MPINLLCYMYNLYNYISYKMSYAWAKCAALYIASILIYICTHAAIADI